MKGPSSLLNEYTHFTHTKFWHTRGLQWALHISTYGLEEGIMFSQGCLSIFSFFDLKDLAHLELVKLHQNQGL